MNEELFVELYFSWSSFGKIADELECSYKAVGKKVKELKLQRYRLCIICNKKIFTNRQNIDVCRECKDSHTIQELRIIKQTKKNIDTLYDTAKNYFGDALAANAFLYDGKALDQEMQKRIDEQQKESFKNTYQYPIYSKKLFKAKITHELELEKAIKDMEDTTKKMIMERNKRIGRRQRNKDGIPACCRNCRYKWLTISQNDVTSCPICGWRVRIRKSQVRAIAKAKAETVAKAVEAAKAKADLLIKIGEIRRV